MNFAPDETQAAIQGLAKQIFRGDAAGSWIHLAKSQLLGGDLGFVALCLVLEQQGRTVAPIPLHATMVCGDLTIRRWGSDDQKTTLLAGVSKGKALLTAALEGRTPPTATADGDGYRLTGTRTAVPWLTEQTTAVLVPARLDGLASQPGAVRLFVVAPSELEATAATATNEQPLHNVRFQGAAAQLLGDGDPAAVPWLVQRATVAACALVLGVAREALILTGKYTNERKQFGVAIASFQAVHQRAADAYIDVQCMDVNLWRAAWLLGTEREATREVHNAAFWAAEGGHRVLAAAQHLHGGMGFDKDYPLHQYFLTAKRWELALGNARQHLQALGGLF
ncbi:MAG: alkylation response protein AidB-like acyl-CoA dehydrogenase [Myxococcota bacterium]|jgi:alkylation response protein AidB-like acyl-CoA dehydrogenase